MTRENKRGYLNGNFKLFHIYDKHSMDFDSHSHDFHKLIFCIDGNVTYIIEGKTYNLSAWDILLVPKNKIHHSKTDSLSAYERIVLFINDEFLENVSSNKILSEGFRRVENDGKCMFQIPSERRQEMLSYFNILEKSSNEKFHDSEILSQSAFITLIININRLIYSDTGLEGLVDDKKLDGVISYINQNFTQPITIEMLTQKFYISRSYLMHKFKSITGGSIHEYITQKRLSYALAMLRNGQRATDVANICGFNDYTVFYKSFKKAYSMSPTDIKQK